MKPHATAMATALFLALGTAGHALASPSQAIEKNKGICESATHHMEQVEDIPTHLLTAISLAETGRWDRKNEANFAWPWTVTAEGKGQYYPSKAVAIAAVKQLKARGVRNIDVGCMQVNLRYHPDAFGNLEQAFDPTINIAYATDFLHKQYQATGSWTDAAAAYHSLTPKHNRTYKMKVLKLWNEVRRKAPAPNADRAIAAATPTAIPKGGHYQGVVPAAKTALANTVDEQRTRLLNRAMKARRQGSTVLKQASVRMRQLDAWRSKQFSDNGQHLAIMQRAEKEAERRLQRAGVRPRSERFASNRRAQLEAWRMALPLSQTPTTVEDTTPVPIPGALPESMPES